MSFVVLSMEGNEASVPIIAVLVLRAITASRTTSEISKEKKQATASD
jgi:hypothetical protein